ncbi:DUF397 domain-containing protein [Nocardiopsis sp. NRRL B-16309]|uniref:DUF397 domain-containing protein n=1 Tax=Nocardiopsis sp. NRRL B-16309 TaxID=1519494 RepID=UPI0006AE6714|nr:DUF397 domain-containing protein [Nocardiopsis sp. NRRL B-16309]KOX10698.1 hypothetical protein ADL05_24520 [Nocardiopsis sp. NRRL B-16309]
MSIPTPPDELFYKSSYSSQGGECVELARTGQHAHLRDTKNRDGLCISVPAQEMLAFLRAAPSE